MLSSGSNGSGQLGLEHKEDVSEISLASAIYLPSKPVKIACGGNHTLVLCENGHVFAAGDALMDFDGEEERIGELQRVRFHGFDTFKDITAGWEFSVFVTDEDRIFSAGIGLNGELGLGKTTKKTRAAQEVIIQGLGKCAVKAIHSSIHSVVVEFDNQQLYGWGHNKKGQLVELAGDKSLKILWSPVLLSFDDEVIDVSMSREFTVFRTSKSIIFNGADKFQIKENLANYANDKIIETLSMWSSLHLQTKAKNLASLGNNSHGQLFPGAENKILTHFAVGSEHGLCYEDPSRTVFAWGWGEHGNCGLEKDKKTIDRVTFDYLNPIYTLKTNEKLVSLFGGCATTWIVLQEVS